ncbi:putative glutathione S-transferase Ure2-like protein [Dipodascopsis uninucleata]
MSSQIKAIKVWGKGGPNPPKVAIILKELGVPYEVVDIAYSDVKMPEYLAINPNGRLPSIQDPNTDITLWESGAIIEYLIERYDTEHKLSFAAGTPEYYYAKQWLYLQTTGQGPYYGQAVWFKKYHPEQLPSAVERYVKEINRLSGVLDEHLASKKKEMGDAAGDGPWLVGDKLSYADISFVPWQKVASVVLSKDEYDESKFPHLSEWLGKLYSRESVKSVLASAFGSA